MDIFSRLFKPVDESILSKGESARQDASFSPNTDCRFCEETPSTFRLIVCVGSQSSRSAMQGSGNSYSARDLMCTLEYVSKQVLQDSCWGIFRFSFICSFVFVTFVCFSRGQKCVFIFKALFQLRWIRWRPWCEGASGALTGAGSTTFNLCWCYCWSAAYLLLYTNTDTDYCRNRYWSFF